MPKRVLCEREELVGAEPQDVVDVVVGSTPLVVDVVDDELVVVVLGSVVVVVLESVVDVVDVVLVVLVELVLDVVVELVGFFVFLTVVVVVRATVEVVVDEDDVVLEGGTEYSLTTGEFPTRAWSI